MQLPFRAAKYDVVVGEPGLGDIYGTHIVLKAQVCVLSYSHPGRMHVHDALDTRGLHKGTA